MARGIKRAVVRARKRAAAAIAAHAASGGFYAHGLAGEGYNGGYRDALDDVLLALEGVHPRREFWRKEP